MHGFSRTNLFYMRQVHLAGTMNFYLSAVDAQLRHPEDQPSIGLLLCKSKNRLTVEYALRDVHKPIGVAELRGRRGLRRPSLRT